MKKDRSAGIARCGLETRRRQLGPSPTKSVRFSVTLPERRRLDCEFAQIHVSLAPVVNLIVDCVLDCPDPGAFPLTKRFIHLAEPVSGNRPKLLVQLCGLLIPQTEQL